MKSCLEWVVGALVMIALLACSPQPSPAPMPWQPSLRWVPCMGADLPGYVSRCALAEVEPAVELSVAVIKPTLVSDALPVVYLPGGPGEGGNTASKLDDWRYWVHDIGLRRPLVLWQARGTLGSAAYFECASFDDWLRHPDLGSDDSMLVAMESCFAQWQATWPNRRGFEQFSSRQSARDLAQILQLLGFEKWHLWASSYGGRTAEWLIHERSGAVASVVFDSAVTGALQKPSDFAKRWVASMEQLLRRACTLNLCSPSELSDQLWLAAEHIHARAKQRGLNISSDVFVHWVFAQAFDEMAVQELPVVLRRFNRATLSRQDLAAIEVFIADKTAPANNPWLYYATLCNDLEVQSQDAFIGEIEELGRWRVLWHSHELTTLCPLLNVTPALLIQPSDGHKASVPAMFLAGQFDPVIPFSAVAKARQQYSQAALIVKPNAAHGILRKRLCGGDWASAFWLAPARFVADSSQGQNADLSECQMQ